MTLDGALLDAHERGDAPALVRLYARAAEEAGGEARAFYLTHAWIFALDCGSCEAEALERRLQQMERV